MKKVVLVTGASSGIGREIARNLASDYEVIIHYNNSYDNAMKLKEELESKYSREFLTVHADLTSEKEIDDMLSDICNHYFKIDILINNAAVAIDTLFIDKTKDNFLKTLDTNLVAPFLLSKKIGTKMYEEKEGIILNISSTNGIDTYYPESIDYDASKAGLINLSHNLATYFAPYVRVNTICSGWVNTEMTANLSDDFKKQETDKILLGRFANPHEVADLVSFLVSDKSSYINDSIIRIDGGKKC